VRSLIVSFQGLEGRFYYELSVINGNIIDSICKVIISCDKIDPGRLRNGLVGHVPTRQYL